MLFVLDLLLAAVILGIAFGLSMIRAFLVHINVINSICLGLFSGIYLYLGNRHIDTFYSFKIHPAICLVIGIAVFFLTYIAQKTKVGFWIFTIIFSLAWAFISATIIYIFATYDMVWFWVVFSLSLIINVSSHIRSRAYDNNAVINNQ